MVIWRRCSSYDAATDYHCDVVMLSCFTVYRCQATVVVGSSAPSATSLTPCTLPAITRPLFSVTGCAPSALNGLQTTSPKRANFAALVRTELRINCALAAALQITTDVVGLKKGGESCNFPTDSCKFQRAKFVLKVSRTLTVTLNYHISRVEKWSEIYSHST